MLVKLPVLVVVIPVRPIPTEAALLAPILTAPPAVPVPESKVKPPPV